MQVPTASKQFASQMSAGRNGRQLLEEGSARKLLLIFTLYVVPISVVPDASKIGLKINEDKTKYMMMSRQNKPTSGKPKISEFVFEIVESFSYLGFKLSRDNSMSLTIDERILAANRSYASLAKLCKSKLLNKQWKLTLYKIIIRPVLCYAAESWTLIEADKTKLQAFERKVLRRIFGAIKDHGDWRIRWNDELNQLIEGENVIGFIKAQQLR